MSGTPTLLSVLVRLSSVGMAVRFALAASRFERPKRIPVDAVLVAAPAANALRAAYSYVNGPTHIAWAAPAVCQLVGLLLAGAGDDLIRDASGLENLKYASPGA